MAKTEYLHALKILLNERWNRGFGSLCQNKELLQNTSLMLYRFTFLLLIANIVVSTWSVMQFLAVGKYSPYFICDTWMLVEEETRYCLHSHVNFIGMLQVPVWVALLVTVFSFHNVKLNAMQQTHKGQILDSASANYGSKRDTARKDSFTYFCRWITLFSYGCAFSIMLVIFHRFRMRVKCTLRGTEDILSCHYPDFEGMIVFLFLVFSGIFLVLTLWTDHMYHNAKRIGNIAEQP